MGSRPRRPARRTGWHPGFVRLATQHGPGNFEVHSEFPLSLERRRADLLLLRRVGESDDARPAKTLRGLWPLIPRVGLVEFKSPSREFRSGDLGKLYSYGFEYFSLHRDEFTSLHELVVVLVTPSVSPALLVEIAAMGGALQPQGNGYAHITDGVHLPRAIIVATNDVAPAENDAYLGIFSHKTMDDPEAALWFRQWFVEEVKLMGSPARIEDLDDILRKLYQMLPPEEVLRRTGLEPEDLLPALTPEQRLAGLSSKERLAGLSSEEVLDGMSDVERKRLLDEARRRAGER